MSLIEKAKLSDVCQIKPPKKEAKVLLAETASVSFVPMKNLGVCNQHIELTEERELNKVYSGYTYFADDDVLLAKITPCFENGKLGIAKGLKNGVGFGSSEYIVFRTSEKVTPEFLFYYLSQNSFRDMGTRVMTGAVGHKRVPKEFIENYEIPLPPLTEQKRIVSILDKSFEAIDKAVANTENNLENSRELFESYLNNVFEQKGDDWEEWEIGNAKLLHIEDGDRGKNYPKKENFFTEGYCLFLNTKNVRPDGFRFDSKMFISKKRDNLLRKGKLQRRDVILTTRGTIGNLAIYDEGVEYEHIRINSGMLIFRPNEGVITSEYLFEILRSSIIKSQIKKYVSGAAQPQLPIKTLVNFTIPVPNSIDSQEKIVTDLKDLSLQTQQLESIYQQKLKSLKELKQSILQKAFTGELTN